mgnify:CR=1 FL=1
MVILDANILFQINHINMINPIKELNFLHSGSRIMNWLSTQHSLWER